MRWAAAEPHFVAETPAGHFYALRLSHLWLATWVPASSADTVRIGGHYRTPAAAKGACKRYAKRMAAAFKAMGKAGWQ